jgi:hypothetical protein
MMIVADALAPGARVPNVQVASPEDVVHEPDEMTFVMLNPAGAGASRVVCCTDWEVPFVNVVPYATDVPAVTGSGDPASVAVAVPLADAGTAMARTPARAMSRLKYRRTRAPCHNR